MDGVYNFGSKATALSSFATMVRPGEVIIDRDETNSNQRTVYFWDGVALTQYGGGGGAGGKGIASTAVTFQASSSGTVTPTGAWSSVVPAVTKGQYLWTRTIFTYSDATTSTIYSVGYFGQDAQSNSTVKWFMVPDAMSKAYSTDGAGSWVAQSILIPAGTVTSPTAAFEVFGKFTDEGTTAMTKTGSVAFAGSNGTNIILPFSTTTGSKNDIYRLFGYNKNSLTQNAWPPTSVNGGGFGTSSQVGGVMASTIDWTVDQTLTATIGLSGTATAGATVSSEYLFFRVFN
jgi:hypothetical protein